MVTFVLTALLLLYFGTLLGFTLITYALFWYETANSSHLEHLRVISKNRIGKWLARGIIMSFLSQNIALLLYPLGLFRKLWQARPDPQCTRPPVILIHGLYHNVSAWILYRYLLKQKGFRNTFAFGYSSFGTSADELLQKLDEKVKEVLGQCSMQRVILIGHSLGGLLAKAYVENASNRRNVAAVIAMGSPHRGSKLAVFGLGKLARSLRHCGERSDDPKKGAGKPEIPRLAVYSPIDNMVLPNEALQVDQPGWSLLESYPLSHVAMLYYKPLAALVIEYLQIRAIPAEGDFESQAETLA